jgi:hypothetical protein
MPPSLLPELGVTRSRDPGPDSWELDRDVGRVSVAGLDDVADDFRRATAMWHVVLPIITSLEAAHAAGLAD